MMMNRPLFKPTAKPASSIKDETTVESKNSVVTVEARPESLTIDLIRTAILVIDMQNDFCAPGGGFDRAGIDMGVVRTVIPFISTVLTAARRAGVQIVYVKMEHQPDLSDLGAPDHPHRIKHQPLSVSDNES
jgi:ureidoacrylate peracid hydrolase